MSILVPKIAVQPEAEPLSLEECYQHLRLTPVIGVDSDGNGTRPDDDLIMLYQTAAREYCEEFTGVSIGVKTYSVTLSAFPDPFQLPCPPFVSVVEAIYDGDESDTLLVEGEDFYVDDSGEIAVVKPINAWPTINTGNNAVFTYRSGYAVPGDASEASPVPGWARVAILLLLEHWYRERGASADINLKDAPFGVQSILRPHRIRLGMA